jgi:predicted aspartyl protease
MLLVPVEVNNAHLTFMLDSGGGSRYLLDAATAKRLQVQLRGEQVTRGAVNDHIPLRLAQDLEIGFGGRRFAHQTAGVTDLGAASAYLGTQVDGMLGAQVFSHAIVEIDYCRGRILLRDSGTGYFPTDAEALPITMVAGHFAVYATLDFAGAQQLAGMLLLDTGAGPIEVALTREAAMREQLFRRNLTEVTVPSVGGKFRARILVADRLHVGNVVLQHVQVYASENEAGGMARGEYLGVLGGEFFRRFVTIFDVPHNRLILLANRGCEPTGSAAAPN